MKEMVYTREIHDDEQKQEKMTSAIADRYCRIILKHTIEQPRSALEISKETGISISTVYRKLEHLCDLNMLRISGKINKDGKKYFFYQSKIRNVSVFFEDGHLTVKTTPNDFHT